MSYDEFKSAIVNSGPNEWSYDDELGKYLYLEDIRITITADRSEESFNNEFHEGWARNFPNEKATRQLFFLHYNGNLIETFYTVSVDGARSYIPYPKLEGMTITREQYAIGKIVNKLLDEVGLKYDDYLSRIGISVNDLVGQD